MPSSAQYECARQHVRESIALKEAVLGSPALIEAIVRVAEEMTRTLRRGGKVLLFGNGGSAADAQHLAAELMGRFERERRALPAIALTANSSNLTAMANDYSYEAVFARQIEGLAKPGDIAVGLTTSGKSPNVLCALRAARKMGVTTVAMTGKFTEAISGLADYCLAVPSSRTARVQEAHMLVGHILCELVENGFSETAEMS